MQGFCSIFALLLAVKKACMRRPLLILSPFLGTPKNARVTLQFRPLLGPGQGKSEVATYVFVALIGDPRECSEGKVKQNRRWTGV